MENSNCKAGESVYEKIAGADMHGKQRYFITVVLSVGIVGIASESVNNSRSRSNDPSGQTYSSFPSNRTDIDWDSITKRIRRKGPSSIWSGSGDSCWIPIHKLCLSLIADLACL